MNSAMQRQRARMIQGALNYAKSDPSDPFAFSRAMSHLRNGICEARTEHGPDGRKPGDPGHYDAEPFLETVSFVNQSGKEEEYKVTRYKNVCRT